MKKKLIYVLALLFFSNYIFSQRNNQYIITNSGDTIKKIKIIPDCKLTNLDQVTYKYLISGKKNTLESNRVKKFYNGKQIYYSINIHKTNSQKLLTYNTFGFLTLAYGYTSGKSMDYYIIKDNIAFDLSKNKSSLKEYFINEVGTDSNFISKKKLHYDNKSIGEYVSSYNVYKYPEKYKAVKYKSPGIFNFGISAAYNFNNIDFDDSEMNYSQQYSIYIGLDFNVEYNRFLTLYFRPNFQKSFFSNKSSNIFLNTIDLNIIYALTLFQKGEFKIKAGTGLAFKAFVSSYIDEIHYKHNDYNNLKIRSFSPEYGLFSFFDINKNISLSISYQFYKTVIKEFGNTLIGVGLSGIEGKTKSISLGLTYNFINKYYQRSDQEKILDYEDF